MFWCLLTEINRPSKHAWRAEELEILELAIWMEENRGRLQDNTGGAY